MQAEKSSPSMFSANRVNNGQSHWLDITGHLGDYYILIGYCTSRDKFWSLRGPWVHNKNKLFMFISLVASEDRTIRQPHWRFFFDKMHTMGTQDHTICTKLQVTMFKWIVERCYECMFVVSNLNRPIFVVSNMETGCRKRLIFSSDLHRGTNNQECYIIIKYEKEILSHSKCLWVKYKFLNVVRLCSRKNLSFQTHKINELADC